MNALRRISYLSLPISVVVGLLAFSFHVLRSQPATGQTENQPAPSWTLHDVHGKTISSADFQGKVVVLDFWATWCGPCLMEIPGYIELQTKYGENGLAMVGVSVDQAEPEVVARFAKQRGINYPIVMADQEIIEAFGGISAIPTTFIIDRHGNIRHHKVGAMPTEQFEAMIRPVLGEE